MRMLDTCATVLSWGTPGSPVDGGGGRWPPLMVRSRSCHAAGPATLPHQVLPRCAAEARATVRTQLLWTDAFLSWLQVRRGKEYCSEVLFQLRWVPAHA